MKKRIVIIMLTMTILAGCTATPALAYTENETDQRGTVVIGVDTETTETDEGNASERETAEAVESAEEAEGTAAGQTTEDDEPVIDRSEPAEALTPEGNMTLVDDSSYGTKQFLTLTTRDGNFYYLIIDRDKDGNENVHFLNQVDERDLISLMDDGEAKKVEEQLERKKEEAEAAQAALAVPTTEPKATLEPAPEPEKMINIAGFEISQKLFIGLIGCLIIIVFCIVVLVKLGKKKKLEKDKPDPDADYEMEYNDEMNIEQGVYDERDYQN